MLTTTIPTAVTSMIVLPVAFCWLLSRHLGTPSLLLFVGAGTFLASQAFRLPLLQGLTSLFASGALPAPGPAYQVTVNIAILSLTAGLFEEGARYLAYRYAIPTARSWNAAVTFGAGHGAMEAIVVGAFMAAEFATMLSLGAPGAAPLLGQSAEEHARLAQQQTQYWATPWYVPLLGALERAFSICFHMTMAVVVLQAVKSARLLWLIAAIAAHATANAIAIATLSLLGPIAAEIVVGLIAALALWVLFRLRPRAPEIERPGAA
jgi:uncharacterized membrane protein YhfC